MSGVLFIVTIPTEQEEQNLQPIERSPSTSSRSDLKKPEIHTYENGAFKIVRFLFIIIILM